MGHGSQGQQGLKVPLHPLPDGLGVAPEPGVHPPQAAPLPVGIQSVEAIEGRNGHQEIAANTAHQALHLAFVVVLARAAELAVEQVVGLELDEQPGALPPSSPRIRAIASFVLS